MELLDLNIKDIDNNWTINDAIRELIANAIDEHILANITNDIKITYNEQTKTLTISNEGRGIKSVHFTENINKEKLNNPKVFGKLGINLKNAIAVLVNNHVNVTIKSDFGIYTPLITNKQGLTEQLPTIHLERQNNFQEQKGTIIVLTPISQQQVDQANNLLTLWKQGKWINSINNQPNNSQLVTNLNQQVIDLKTQLKNTSDDAIKLSSLHNEVLVLQNKLSDKNNELNSVHQELTNTSNQLSKMAQQLTDNVHHSNELKNDLELATKENEQLKTNLKKLNDETSEIEELLKDPIALENYLCPDCGSRLVIRQNHKNHNKFYGCSNYPYCEYVKQFKEEPKVPLKTKVQNLQAENKSLHEQLITQKTKFNKDLEDTKQSLNKQYQLRVDEWYENIKNQTDKTISELQTKLQSKLDKNDADLLTKTSEIVQLKQSLAKLKIEKNELTSQLLDQKINYSQLANELKTKDHLLQEINNKLEVQTKQVKELTVANDNLTKQITNLQTENNSLKNKVAQAPNSSSTSDLLNHPVELLKTLILLIPSTRKITLTDDLTTITKSHILYVAIHNKLYQVSTWLQTINQVIKTLYALLQGQFIEKLWDCSEGKSYSNLTIEEKNESSLVFKTNYQLVNNNENITLKIADTIYRLIIANNKIAFFELIKYIFSKLNISLDNIYFICY